MLFPSLSLKDDKTYLCQHAWLFNTTVLHYMWLEQTSVPTVVMLWAELYLRVLSDPRKKPSITSVLLCPPPSSLCLCVCIFFLNVLPLFQKFNLCTHSMLLYNERFHPVSNRPSAVRGRKRGSASARRPLPSLQRPSWTQTDASASYLHIHVLQWAASAFVSSPGMLRTVRVHA